MCDLSSALLSLRSHTSWRTGTATPLAALTDAKRWLRGLTGRAVYKEAIPWLLSMMRADDQRRLCTATAERYARSHPDTHTFASVHWAPFTAAGSSYHLPQHGPADGA